MPGTVKIWWHDGAVTDVRHNDIPVVNEPELGYEAILVGSTPAVSGPAPGDARVAIVETDIDVRYLVRRPGDSGLADSETSKPIAAAAAATDAIGISPGYTISFVET